MAQSFLNSPPLHFDELPEASRSSITIPYSYTPPFYFTRAPSPSIAWHFATVASLPSRGGLWLARSSGLISVPKIEPLPRRSVQPANTPIIDTRIPPDASFLRGMMNASPGKLKGRDTTTTISIVTSTAPVDFAKAAFSPITTNISTLTTTAVITPAAASHSSCSPGPNIGTSASGSNGSASRVHHHKSKRHSISSSCESGSATHDSPRIVLGPGTISRLPTELGRLHLSRPLIVSSPSRIALARRIQALIPNLESRILDSAVVNVPTKVVDDAVARITGHDVVISVGAGSAIGLAKAISIRKGIPHICIPTTYSGSEMSPLLAADGRKMGHKGSKVMPTVIIYDEDLTGMNSVPKKISAPTAASAAPARRRSWHDDDAPWSYIHLPGV